MLYVPAGLGVIGLLLNGRTFGLRARLGDTAKSLVPLGRGMDVSLAGGVVGDDIDHQLIKFVEFKVGFCVIALKSLILSEEIR